MFVMVVSAWVADPCGGWCELVATGSFGWLIAVDLCHTNCWLVLAAIASLPF